MAKPDLHPNCRCTTREVSPLMLNESNLLSFTATMYREALTTNHSDDQYVLGLKRVTATLTTRLNLTDVINNSQPIVVTVQGWTMTGYLTKLHVSPDISHATMEVTGAPVHTMKEKLMKVRALAHAEEHLEKNPTLDHVAITQIIVRRKKAPLVVEIVK